MYELSIIKEFINNRNSYINYRNVLRKEDITDELKPIYDAVDLWYQNNTEAPALEDVANLVFSAPTKDGQRDYLKATLNRLDTINGEETVQNLLESFRTNRILIDLSSTAYDAQRGYKPLSEVLSLAKRLEEPLTFEIEYVSDDLQALLDKTYRTPGLRWRLDSLNRSLGSLRKGDFGFVFARPETGKTTFLASEVTAMAGQLTNEDGPILWLNNEEKSEKVLQRCYQAALGLTKDQLDKGNSEELRKKFRKATSDRLLMPKLRTTSRREIESIILKEKPRLVLIDQIDNVTGFKADRKDLELGETYKWSRYLADECTVIGVCQADVTGENQKWLYMNNVANAKTEKQGAADFIIGIGKIHDQGYEYIRYINISKNKLSGDPDTDSKLNHAKIEVLIRPEIARYEDV